MNEPSLPEESIFLQAVQIESAAERVAYLDRVCGADPKLRADVEALLRGNDKSGDLLDLTENRDGTTDQPIAERLGTKIGPYKLVQQLGEGGMGTVFLAEQAEPVERRVALKLIKPGMDSAQILRRFEAERQALALMDHSNIAKVLDAGTTADGRPYFVMELVKGVPITKYCDELRLSLGERLALFVPVCQSIQHAHQKGIIHRDIKPSNVLIAMQDGRPVPKVIDFGVAKALHQRLTDESLYTDIGQIVGTLEYMSPEQAELSPLDIDTRADVYALGVLFYELLTGTTPLDRKRIKQAAYTEMLRQIREVEPPKPSTRLSDSRETLASVAAMRQTEPARLTNEMRGELDWIAMKCLEKDRTRRYESASGLARDVERYLQDETVEACPPSTRYRMGKFLRKHRASVLTTAALLGLLLAGVAVSTWQAVRATVAEAKARDNESEAIANEKKALAAATAERTAKQEAQEAAEAEKKAKEAETAERKQAEAVANLLESVFRGLDPNAEEKGGLSLVQQLVAQLDVAAASLDEEYTGQPLVRARLRDALGETQRGLGEPSKAVALHERALAERRQHLGPNHLDTLESMNNLTWAYLDAGQFDKALPLSEETLKKHEVALGTDDPGTLKSMNTLAVVYLAAGQLEKAISLLEETLKKTKAKFGPDHPNTLKSMNNLACAYDDDGQKDKALRLSEETLVKSKANLDPNDPFTLASMSGLAQSYKDAGRLDEAIPLYEETLEKQKAKLGPDHPDTLRTTLLLAEAYGGDRGVSLFEATLEKQKTKLGPDHPDTLNSMNNLATSYWGNRRLDRSVPLFEEILNRFRAKLGPDHFRTLIAQGNLGVNYRDAGRVAEGIELMKKALELATAGGKPLPAKLVFIRQELAVTYDLAGEFAKAEPLYRESLEQARRQFGDEDSRTAGQMAALSLCLLHQQKYADAEPLLRECLPIREAKEPDDWRTFNTKSLLGGSLLGQEKSDEAEPLLVAGYEGMQAREERIPPQGKVRLAEALERLVRLYEATGDKDEAEMWRKKLAETTPAGR